MAGINNFKAFATDQSANVLTQAQYEALAALGAGFVAGIAKSAEVNKVLRQGSSMAAAIGKIVADANLNAMDDGDTATLAANILAALYSTLGFVPVPGGTMTGPIHFNGTPDVNQRTTFLTQQTNSRCVRLWGGTEGLSGVLALHGQDFIDTSSEAFAFKGSASLGSCDKNGNIKWLKPEISGQLSYNNIPIARYCLPSTTYKAVTLPVSGGTVQNITDDGWLQLSKRATAAGQYIYLKTPSLTVRTYSTGANTLDIVVPVSKYDNVQVNYTADGSLDAFRFYYNKGSEWAAS